MFLSTKTMRLVSTLTRTTFDNVMFMATHVNIYYKGAINVVLKKKRSWV